MAEEKDKVKEPEEDAVEEVDDLKMSRTEEPEITFKIKDIRDKFVFDANGNKIRFGDIYKKQKTIIFFVRVSISQMNICNMILKGLTE